MHFHLEIIMPPTTELEAQIENIMAPFDESGDDVTPAFWDWYVIGGRWAGYKAKARLDPDKLEAFEEWLNQEKILVKNVQAGKQELADATTARKVDAKWREVFPGQGEYCMLFNHANDQYKNSDLDFDVCKLSEIPNGLTALRVIIAGPAFKSGKYEAVYMTQSEFWNGVNYVSTVWDGTVASALDELTKKLGGYTHDYALTRTPTDDWLVVTVDYHS